MILKAGTYRFNDTIPKPTTWVSQDLSFTVIMEGDTFTITRVMVDDYGLDAYVEEMGSTFYGYGWAENTWFTEGLETWTFAKDTEVSDTFGTWYIANTNYNEVNAKPLAEITYNGQVIASLNSGETATLSCEGMKMASDVVVKVNEVEHPIPNGYVYYIAWDGVTTGLSSFKVYDTDEQTEDQLLGTFYKVSDRVLTAEDLQGAFQIVRNAEPYDISLPIDADVVEVWSDDFLWVLGDATDYTLCSGYEGATIVHSRDLPETGTYLFLAKDGRFISGLILPNA